MSQTNSRPAALTRRRHGRDDRGAVAVEFALVVLPLVVIVFGIIGFGIQFSQQLALSHAARESARFASVASYGSTGWTPPSCAQVTARAREAARSMVIDTSQIAVTVTRDGAACGSTGGACTGASSTSSVKVRLSYASGIVLPFVPWDGNVTAEGVFRCEYS